MRLRTTVGRVARGIAKHAGYRILRTEQVRGYIDCNDTLSAAQALGISVPEYVAKLWGEVGVVDAAIAKLVAVCNLPPNANVLEIGPGTGRFLERVREVLKPARYEIYETDTQWANYLGRMYGVINHRASGYSLSETADKSCDLIHAHQVFVYLPVTTAFRYFTEMCRVTKPNGYIAFDSYLHDRCDLAAIEDWSRSDETYQTILPRDTVMELFARNGFDLVAESDMKAFVGKSRYLVFRRRDAEQ